MDTIKELQGKLSTSEEKLEQFQEIIISQDKKIEILEKNTKNEEEKFIIRQENIITVQDDFLDDELKNSKIVINEENELIKKWIDVTKYNKVFFKLLYRASEHGKSAKNFHSRCDGKVT